LAQKEIKNSLKMKQLTQQQVNKKYKNTYVEVREEYDYSEGIYLYEVLKTSKVIKENMTLGQDVGTSLAYSR
jgi:rhamnogalacturonyl hydrolase YesR